MDEQISIYSFMPKAPRYDRASWLRAQGFKNIYDEEPPTPGMYEWRDIETPDRGKILEYNEHGGIYLGRLAMGRFNPRWWRPIRRDMNDNE